MSDIAIRFEHVSKCFKRGENFDSLRDLIPNLVRRIFGRTQSTKGSHIFWALNDISLEIHKGETVGVIGHNGAGKSTMLKHFSGIMVPTKGYIDINGRLSALIEVGAGFHQDLTGRENIFLNGVILGMSRSEVARKFDEIVEFAELSEFIDTPVKRYSSGMYARLGFSVAAHLDPDILVIDEVLSVGDFVFRQKSLQKMRSVAEGGATVIFVSHNLKAVSDLCTRTILMDQGSIKMDGPTSQVIQNYLDGERKKLGSKRNGIVIVKSVALRSIDGSQVRIKSGSKIWVDITLIAHQSCEQIAVDLSIHDNSLVEIFNISSVRLGMPALRLSEGQTATVTFQLDMHLAAGTFHIGIFLHRHDIERTYDRILPATTFFIESDIDVRGAANLYPCVTLSNS